MWCREFWNKTCLTALHCLGMRVSCDKPSSCVYWGNNIEIGWMLQLGMEITRGGCDDDEYEDRSLASSHCRRPSTSLAVLNALAFSSSTSSSTSSSSVAALRHSSRRRATVVTDASRVAFRSLHLLSPLSPAVASTDPPRRSPYCRWRCCLCCCCCCCYRCC
jgi:hypothetical protein